MFGAIILFHEFGHFIVARKNGIIVEEFMIGMGPKLFGFQKGDTVYTIALRLNMPAYMLKLVSSVIVIIAIAGPYLHSQLPLIRRRVSYRQEVK